MSTRCGASCRRIAASHGGTAESRSARGDRRLRPHRAQARRGPRTAPRSRSAPTRCRNARGSWRGRLGREPWSAGRTPSPRRDVDVVIVATTNDALTPIAVAAVEAGKHVLVEKPAARTVEEIDRLLAAARAHDRRVRVGFNHRYHPALLAARAAVDAGALGPLMFIRGRYGHGGRVGYEREWRADPAKSGGGELIDQGVHLIDLAALVPGPASPDVRGTAATYFWDMPVDDNAFLLLERPAGQVAFLHVSCTEWKNLFSLEIYGRDGKIAIDGLGGSYGVERFTLYKMLPRDGTAGDDGLRVPARRPSWALEFGEFLDDIRLGREPAAGLDAARAALSVVERIYQQSGYDGGAPPPATSGVDQSMIITRSPLRITLGGGGTDLPVVLPRARRIPHRRGDRQVRLRDRHAAVHAGHLPEVLEARARRDRRDVHHPIIREAIKLVGFSTPQIEITTLADIPAGTGLGSSGSFTTALLKALYAHRRRLLHPSELAELACEIEIDRLREPIGKQDQYIAAYGGLTCFTFHKDGTVEAEPLKLPIDAMFNLEDNLLLFFTGFSRTAGSILADQEQRTGEHDAEMLDNLHYVKDLGHRSRLALEKADTAAFGELMHEHWEHKKRRSKG